MSISDRLDETTERAARVIGAVMSRWDMDGRPDVAGGIDTLIARALADAGRLASLTEWDVEYRSDDGYVSRHTDDVFDEMDLGYEQAKEYADAYNDLDWSPGVAVVVRRYVTDWEEA